MKDLTDATPLDNQELKFQINEGEKKNSLELVGYKETGEKVKKEEVEPILTKEELKNRELEKVKNEYALQKKEEEENKLFKYQVDINLDPSPFSESDTNSVASSETSSRKSEEKKSVTAQRLALAEELNDAVDSKQSASQKSEVNILKPMYQSFCIAVFLSLINLNDFSPTGYPQHLIAILPFQEKLNYPTLQFS